MKKYYYEERNIGTLTPGSAKYTSRCDFGRAPVAIVNLGGNELWATKFPFVAIKLDDRPVLAFDMVGTTLIVKTLYLRGRNGVIATDTANVCEIRRGFLFKREDDDSTLIVYDKKNIPVLKIKYINPSVISVEGEFQYGNSRISITENNVKPDSLEPNRPGPRIVFGGPGVGNCLNGGSFTVKNGYIEGPFLYLIPRG